MQKRTLAITEKGLNLPSGVAQKVDTGRYEPDSHSALHSHTHLQLYFVTSGKGALQFPLFRCFVHSGDVVLINPNISHTEYSSQLKPLEYVALELAHLEVLPKEGIHRGYLQFHREDFDELLSMVRIIVTELEHPQPHSRTLCDNLINSILIRLLRENNFELLHPLRSETDCQRVHHYITNHFAEQIDLDSLAALGTLNKFHLAHSFKEIYGISINNYLQDCRIQEAARLLVETKLNITEIGRMVGFNTPCHFNTIFRDRMQTTPRDYRKANRQ